MPHVVTEGCIRCVFTDCVDVCPVDCFHDVGDILVIDPEECIDCGVCIPVCPVEAIFLDDDVPEEQEEFIEINARFSKDNPILFAPKEAHPEAEKYSKISQKRHFLAR
jgi:ferredoxin